MKLVTNKFKSGGLHEKHAVTTLNLENYLSIYLGVSSPFCVNELGLACSVTQLCQYKYIY